METPSPTDALGSRSEVLVAYLDAFREQLIEGVGQLTTSAQRRPAVASGWSPLELLQHLTFVETRWLEWGFAGRPLTDPWGDQRDGVWRVAQEDGYASLVGRLRAQGERSQDVFRRHDLDEVGAPGPRWPPGASPSTLERVALHLLQEYARHLGHLDVVVELAENTKP